MENLQFDIEEKRTRELPIYLIALILFVIGSFILIPTGEPKYLITFFFCMAVASYLLINYYPYGNIVGQMIFERDKIIIKSKTETINIYHKEIEEFYLNYTLPRGIYYRRYDLGNNNKVKIKINGFSYDYFLCIRNKAAEKRLKSAMLGLYENRVKISESVFDLKSYGLEYLDYKEIQVFKQKYLMQK